jgi:hypothetical protein
LTSLFVFSANAKGETVKLIETEGTVGGMPAPMFLGEDIKYSLPLFVFRTTQYLKFRLKKEEKLLHKKAVFFMLENAELGKIVSWYSDKRHHYHEHKEYQAINPREHITLWILI